MKEEYICLKNEEDQYSLWLAHKDIPLGWQKVGPIGSKEECLYYIKNIWTDMRPRSLREEMDSKKDL